MRMEEKLVAFKLAAKSYIEARKKFDKISVKVAEDTEIEKRYNYKECEEKKKKAFWTMIITGVRFAIAFSSAQDLGEEKKEVFEYYIKKEHKHLVWMIEHQVAGLFLKLALMDSEIPKEFMIKRVPPHA